MKTNIKKGILESLSKDYYVTSSKLALKFHVTSRTIQNYIRELNSNQTVIESSRRFGYKLVTDFSHEKSDNIPNFQIEREFFLVKALIQNPSGISVFDLSSELCISTSTLAKDISNLRHTIDDFDLKLLNRKGYIYLRGDEIKKRRLIREIIIANQSQLNHDFMHFFDHSDINTDDIKELVVSVLKDNNIYVNDYSLMNLVVHISITISRLKQNAIILNPELLNLIGFQSELKVANEIVKHLNRKYQVSFNEQEINHLAFQMITKTSTINFQKLTQDNIAYILGQEYLDLTFSIIDKVNKQFFIDIFDEEFILKFTLHLKNVLFRSSYSFQERNPLTKDFKQTYPLIYDIAVFISIELKKEIGEILTEDEITFIAFHIGAIIDRKNQLSKKLKCILIYQNYYDFHRSTLMHLTSHFSNEFEIVEVSNSFEGKNFSDFDIIISTSPLSIAVDYVQINPYLTEKDFKAVDRHVQMLRNRESKQIVFKYFNDFFKPNLFEINHYFANEFDAIHYMSERLLDEDYITQDFEKAVIEREQLASTSFDNGIAIPHSLTTSAIKNCSYVIINEKPIKWGDYKVRVILLIGINDNERYIFKDVYGNILNIFDSSEQTNRLLNCQSFTEFMAILKDNSDI